MNDAYTAAYIIHAMTSRKAIIKLDSWVYGGSRMNRDNSDDVIKVHEKCILSLDTHDNMY